MRGQRLARLESAFEIERVENLLFCELDEPFSSVLGGGRRALAVVFVEPFERARAQLLADELVDRAVQQPRVVGELLGGVVHAARGDHRRQIVVAEVPVDELLRRALDQRRAQRVGVQVVEHDDVQPPLERVAVGLRVRRNDALRVEEALGLFDRDVDLGEQLDLLRLAVLEDLEVVLGQPRHEVALRVGDERVHLDVVDLGLEGDGRRRLRAARARGLTGWLAGSGIVGPPCGVAGAVGAGCCCAPGPPTVRLTIAPMTNSPRRIGMSVKGCGHSAAANALARVQRPIIYARPGQVTQIRAVWDQRRGSAALVTIGILSGLADWRGRRRLRSPGGSRRSEKCTCRRERRPCSTPP